MKLITALLSFFMCMNASLIHTADRGRLYAHIDAKETYEITDIKSVLAEFDQQELEQNMPLEEPLEDRCSPIIINVGFVVVAIGIVTHCYALLSAFKFV